MKRKTIYMISLFAGLLTACDDMFLNRNPETSISRPVFFKNIKDMELYTNIFYTSVPDKDYMDYISDNSVCYMEIHENLDLLRGSVLSSTVGGWNEWDKLRRFNYLLENVRDVKGPAEDINHYIGLARLQRAIWYYNMVKRYNDVPWYSKTLKENDPLLYKARDSRTLVVDSIMSDLDFSVRWVSEEMKNKTVFNKWYAYAVKARICLHEATFRKYHDEQNLQESAGYYFNQAINACQEIMNSGYFDIDKTGGIGEAYANLFKNYDLSSSPEILFFLDYDMVQNIKHAAGAAVFSHISNLSRSLMESYEVLTVEGKAVPFTSLPGYDTCSFVEVFKNRDPRFAQTFMPPGYVKAGESLPFRPNLNLGGYPQIKFVPGTSDQIIWGECYTDLPVSRYAEILLIYAEAKAELGVINQKDLDRSVNKIRDRAGMPPIILNDLPDDWILKEQYPLVTGKDADIILQIRRERRIELVSENFRYDDLMRWKAGHLLTGNQEGVYVGRLGLLDFSGDGHPDIGLFEDEEHNDVPDSIRGKYTYYYLYNKNGSKTAIGLTKGTSGHIYYVGDKSNPKRFIEPKYYYFPIPQTQKILNPNLKETCFW